MSTEPLVEDVYEFSGRALAGMGETFARRAGTLLGPLVVALTGPLAATDKLTLAADQTGAARPWPLVSDLDLGPFPAWLGMATGTPVPAGLTVTAQRAYVLDAPYRRRGTVRAMLEPVQALLSGAKRCALVERLDGDAYRLAVRAHATDAAGTTTAAIAAAATAAKPVGLVLDHVELVDDTFEFPRWWRPDRVSYARMSANHATYPNFATAYPTYALARDATRTQEP